MEYVVKFPPRPHTQALTCGAFLGAVLPLVLLDETLLPASLRAPLKATSPSLWLSLRHVLTLGPSPGLAQLGSASALGFRGKRVWALHSNFLCYT